MAWSRQRAESLAASGMEKRCSLNGSDEFPSKCIFKVIRNVALRVLSFTRDDCTRGWWRARQICHGWRSETMEYRWGWEFHYGIYCNLPFLLLRWNGISFGSKSLLPLRGPPGKYYFLFPLQPAPQYQYAEEVYLHEWLKFLGEGGGRRRKWCISCSSHLV